MEKTDDDAVLRRADETSHHRLVATRAGPARCALSTAGDGGVGGLLIISQLIQGPVVVNREHARASGLTPSGIGNFSAPQRRTVLHTHDGRRS